LTLTGAPDAKSRVPEKLALDRIVDIHEVDEVFAVAAEREFTLPRHHPAQPSGGDFSRRLIRAVGAEEADVHEAADRLPALGEETHVLFGGQLRNGVWQPRGHRRGRRDVANQPIVDGA
jgi:hypothetical protein